MADYPPVTSQPEGLNLVNNYGTTSSDDPLAELEKTSEVQLHLSKRPGVGMSIDKEIKSPPDVLVVFLTASEV